MVPKERIRMVDSWVMVEKKQGSDNSSYNRVKSYLLDESYIVKHPRHWRLDHFVINIVNITKMSFIMYYILRFDHLSETFVNSETFVFVCTVRESSFCIVLKESTILCVFFEFKNRDWALLMRWLLVSSTVFFSYYLMSKSLYFHIYLYSSSSFIILCFSKRERFLSYI